MERTTENKIILIRQATRLDDLIVRFNTTGQAKFYIEHLGADFTDYLKEHDRYNLVIDQAHDILSALGRVQMIEREFLPNFLFGKNDLVIAVGRDGLIANTLKYLTNQRLIGVNPDPTRWDGVLLPFSVKDLSLIVPEVFADKRIVREITMAKATLNDGQELYGVNDLFIGQKTHVSARYNIEYRGEIEFQSSSGIIVSTGLGSTGWFKSILAGAKAIYEKSSSLDASPTKKEKMPAKMPSKKFEKIAKKKQKSFKKKRRIKWDSNFLFYSVREPFPTKTTKTNLVFGKVSKQNPLTILSQMPENGVIFSDGIEDDFLSFNSGVTATINIAEKKGRLVV